MGICADKIESKDEETRIVELGRDGGASFFLLSREEKGGNEEKERERKRENTERKNSERPRDKSYA